MPARLFGEYLLLDTLSISNAITALDFKSAQFDPVYNKDQTDVEILSPVLKFCPVWKLLVTEFISTGLGNHLPNYYGTVGFLHATTDQSMNVVHLRIVRMYVFLSRKDG